MLCIRTGDDRRASAVIRDTAMTLWAEHGDAGVTVRRIAAEAGVSPALVIHHFGSKAGLREAVDGRVGAMLEQVLGELAAGSGSDTGSLAEAFARTLDEHPGVLAYVRRMLLDGSDAGTHLFAELFRATRTAMESLVAAGVVRPSEDEEVRDAFLLVNDLAVILLRDQLAAVLGVDPLGRPGMARWSAQVMDVYTGGVFR
jgi:TetR/AcrR family transcriptional regulator, regulator of cefoperazone and chloramphenicol sensitivity